MAEQAIEKLRAIPLFTDLAGDDAALGEVLAITTERRVPSGAVVIEEGESGDELFIVRSGGVEIRKQTRAGDSYTVVRLRETDNVFFGELALIDDDRRSATVIATENSEFLVIRKSDFLALGERAPHIALPITRAIARILAGRVRRTTVDMMTIFDALVHELEST